jgi:hypothetical protein
MATDWQETCWGKLRNCVQIDHTQPPFQDARIQELPTSPRRLNRMTVIYQARRVGFASPQIHAEYVWLFVSREQVDHVDLTKESVASVSVRSRQKLGERG